MSIKTEKKADTPPVTNKDNTQSMLTYPDSKVHGANMRPTWGQQDPGRPLVSPMKIAVWVGLC